MGGTSRSALAAAQKFQGISLEEDSAAHGGDVPPQLAGGMMNETVQMPNADGTQETIPEDFWKPVETPSASTACHARCKVHVARVSLDPSELLRGLPAIVPVDRLSLCCSSARMPTFLPVFAADWITPSTNPEWFGQAAVAAAAGPAPEAASAALPSQNAAPVGMPPSTDVYGVDTRPMQPASAPAAVATPTETYQFALSDFAGSDAIHDNDVSAAQQPPTPAQAEPDRGSGQLVASPTANDDGDMGLDDLLAMLTA